MKEGQEKCERTGEERNQEAEAEVERKATTIARKKDRGLNQKEVTWAIDWHTKLYN